MNMYLDQWSKQPDYHLYKVSKSGLFVKVFISNFVTLREQLLKVSFNVCNCFHICHKTGVLKMVVETAVVKINGTADGHHII